MAYVQTRLWCNAQRRSATSPVSLMLQSARKEANRRKRALALRMEPLSIGVCKSICFCSAASLRLIRRRGKDALRDGHIPLCPSLHNSLRGVAATHCFFGFVRIDKCLRTPCVMVKTIRVIKSLSMGHHQQVNVRFAVFV